MSFRGTEYADKIKELAKLKAIDRPAYKNLLKSIRDEYKISDSTIYRDMKDLSQSITPGTRKKRKDAGEQKSIPTPEEIKLVSEVKISQGTFKAGKEIAEKKLGKKISNRKLNKIKTEIDNNDIVPEETNFGSKGKELLEKIFEFDLMAPESVFKFEFKDLSNKKHSVAITKEEIADVILILANAYNRKVDPEDMLSADRISLFRNKLFYSAQEMLTLATERGDIDGIEQCSRMLTRLESKNKIELPNDFHVYYKAMKKLKGDLTEEEAIDLLTEQLDM
ncbi:MAG TPA: hypothetical protein PLG90_13130 [Ignavibacteria bacterium]|nr:hypothetical protein [Ignavibacteria bacterium]